MHEDQETIKLVSWSRVALMQCEAVHDSHYPMSEAGVWADCARIKAPVVHNDYRSLPERKGLPEGHSELVRHLSVPVVEDDSVRVIMSVGNKPEDYHSSDARQLQLLANDAWQIVRRRRTESRLEVMARTDSLTGLSNRRQVFEIGAVEVRRAQRYGGPLSVLMLDIDGFKSINDSYGHDVGDTVLREFAGTVQRSLREVDTVGRVGGEEFAIVLPNTDDSEARLLAERLLRAARQTILTASGTTFSMTVSAGLATLREGMDSFEDLLKAADVALYEAKNSGGDCIAG